MSRLQDRFDGPQAIHVKVSSRVSSQKGGESEFPVAFNPCMPVGILASIYRNPDRASITRTAANFSPLDYGNEVEAGQGVARAIKEGLVKREDLFIVSKLWQTFHDYEQVEPITKKQLKDWGIDYFDLYLIHFPVALKYVSPETRYPPGWFSDDANSKVIHSNARLEDTWRAFEDIKQKGLTKSIGVSNYSGALLLDLFTYAKVKPATLQIEHHPYYVQPYLIKLAEEHDIKVTAYSSFGPQSFIECDMKIAADTPLLFDHPVIKKISEKHGKTPAQVLLRWSTQRGLSVIPKSNSQNRLQQNLDVTGFNMSESEIQEISDLDKNLKFNAPTNVRSLLLVIDLLSDITNNYLVRYSLLRLCLDT
jgi:D-xylose reductase